MSLVADGADSSQQRARWGSIPRLASPAEAGDTHSSTFTAAESTRPPAVPCFVGAAFPKNRQWSPPLGPGMRQVDTRLLRQPPLTDCDFISSYESLYPPPILLRELVSIGGQLSASGNSFVWPESDWLTVRPPWADHFQIIFELPVAGSSTPTLAILPCKSHSAASVGRW